MKNKKLLAVILSVILLVSVCPLGVFTFTASAATYSGNCGENTTWSYNTSTYTLTISGTGEMYDYTLYVYSSDGGVNKNVTVAPWGLYFDIAKKIIIHSGVTSIGNHAFYGCTGLTSVTIPDSVTSIGDAAFYGCTGLTSITIPDSVTSIGISAFRGCSGLTLITIPDSVNSSGEGAFYGCTGLKTAGPIGGGYDYEFGWTDTIPGYAFNDCDWLTSITIPDSVTSIGYAAFYGCTGLTSVTIPDSVTSIGNWAFCGCTGLTSVTIPDSVTSIKYCAFSGCTGLTSVTIGDSVTSIDDYAFYGCTGLTDVYYTGAEKQKSDISIGENGNDYLLNATWHYNYIPPCEHTNTGWKTIVKATLTDSGLKREICSRCGEVLGEAVIPALGITYDLENPAENKTENISVAVSPGSNLPETVEIIAKKAEITEDSITYEIHLENEGTEIQPDAPVLVKVPIPAELDKDKLNVYRREPDGSKTRMDIIIDGDFAYFETEHFSIYEIIEKLCGDINNDGEVNNKDLTRLFQHLSEWDVEVNEAALDINGDGDVNNKDLTRLFQYLSEWDVEIF